MKINCGPSPEANVRARAAKEERLKDWHDFYAILPRRVGENDCRVLELIERKGRRYLSWVATKAGPCHMELWHWEYRSKE